VGAARWPLTAIAQQGDRIGAAALSASRPVRPQEASLRRSGSEGNAAATVAGLLPYMGVKAERPDLYPVSWKALLSFAADLIGTGTRNPEAMTPLLILPPLIFGLLSTGIQPVQQFPRWIQPFVRDQPISQFVDALRALAGDTTGFGGSVTWSGIAPSLAWICGLAAVLVPVSAIVLSRRA